MKLPDVFIVMLRQPRRNDPRSDPYYEFGSFGLTKCHSRNLLHPKKAEARLNGARLAFVQGGKGGVRLICVTTPIKIVVHPKGIAEARWTTRDSRFRFIKYDNAPEITKIVELERMIRGVDRLSMQAKFASKFRSFTKPLPPEAAKKLMAAFARVCRSGKHLASSYEEALPIVLDEGTAEKNRRQCRNQRLRTARGQGVICTTRRRPLIQFSNKQRASC